MSHPIDRSTWESMLRQRIATLAEEAGGWGKLAKRVGVAPSTLQNVREGKSVPGAWTLSRICVSMGRDPNWVFGADAAHSGSVDREALLEVIKVIRDADKQRKTPISDEVFAEKLAEAYERNLQAKRDIQEIAENE